MGRRRPLVGRELWRIGDWGGASAQIGKRWEELGAAALSSLVRRPGTASTDFWPYVAVSFVQDAACERAVQAAGLSHADALLIGLRGADPALQPVDFKWSLEVAESSQVAAETLADLLAAELVEVSAALRDSISQVNWGIGGAPSMERFELLDGLFLAPDHHANRAFLLSQVNLRREAPLREEQVVLSPVDGATFFSPLPGWELGTVLAGQEGARRALETLEGAERYYRLGAGVQGALMAARRSIFDAEAPEIDFLSELSQLRRTQRLATTEQLIVYLDRIMAARGERLRSLRQLGRVIFPQAAYRAVLAQRGIVWSEPAEGEPEQRRWGRVYGQVLRELSFRLVTEGRGLVAAGQSDAQALVELKARATELSGQAINIAERLIQAELVAGVEPGAPATAACFES